MNFKYRFLTGFSFFQPPNRQHFSNGPATISDDTPPTIIDHAPALRSYMGEQNTQIDGVLTNSGGKSSSAHPWRRTPAVSTDDGYVTCPHCFKPITSYNLNRHIKMVHQRMERAKCSLCGKMFKNKYSLSTHLHRQHHYYVAQGHHVQHG